MFTSEQILEHADSRKGHKFVILGIMAGYSDISIMHYMWNRYQPDYDPNPPEGITNPLVGTGCIFHPSEWSIPVTEIVQGIQERRLIPVPFPKGSDYLSRWENTVKHVQDERLVKRYNNLYPQFNHLL